MIVKDVLWFSPGRCHGTIGILLAEDDVTGERKAYVGIGDSRSGEEADIHTIKEWGAKLTEEQVKLIAKHFGWDCGV